MARDILSNWKQSVAYYFVDSSCSGNSLRSIFGESINWLTSTGLTVRGMVSDLVSNCIALENVLGINRNNSTFQIAGKRCYIFDAPRNHFITKRFEWLDDLNGSKLHTHFENVKQILTKLKKSKLAFILQTNKGSHCTKANWKNESQTSHPTVKCFYSFNLRTFTAAIGTMEFVKKFDSTSLILVLCIQ